MAQLVASDRRLRCKVEPGGVLKRRPYGVRWPYERSGGTGSWGTEEDSVHYAMRSWLDGQSRLLVSTSNTAASGLSSGNGEPIFTVPPPGKKAAARRLLTTKNSKRDVIEWKHTHMSNYTTEKDQQGNIPDPSWWDWVSGAGIPHPEAQEIDGAWKKCPVPLSDDATWVYYEDVWDQCGPIRVRRLQIITAPCDIQEHMVWSGNSDTLTGVRVDIKRNCSRVLCYKNCVHDGESLTLPDIAFILREPPPGAHSIPDRRFHPWSYTDCTRNLTGGSSHYDSVPVGEAANTLQRQNRTLIDKLQPDHVGDYDYADGFTSEDASSISASKLFSALAYESQVWAKTGAVDSGVGLSYIESGRPFDLIVCADFYRWVKREYNPSSEYEDERVMEEVGRGFAGTYGKVYAIY